LYTVLVSLFTAKSLWPSAEDAIDFQGPLGSELRRVHVAPLSVDVYISPYVSPSAAASFVPSDDEVIEIHEC
jgi:hypothetical protein